MSDQQIRVVFFDRGADYPSVACWVIVCSNGPRLDSFLDGLCATVLGNNGETVKRRGFNDIKIKKGQSVIYYGGRVVETGATAMIPASALADWDAWVQARVEQRQQTLAAAMKASGLKASIAGLADLYNEGTFFDCSKYGKCWQPNELAEDARPAAPSAANDYMNNVHGPQESPAQQAPGTPLPKRVVRYYPLPDCSQLRQVVETDPITGADRVIEQTVVTDPWTSASCYAGGYIFQTRFIYVVGRQHHHRHCHYVKVGGNYGYVPRHPADQKGKPPLNLKHGVLTATASGSVQVQRLATKSNEKVESLASVPKSYASEHFAAVDSAPRPQLQARFLTETADFVHSSGANHEPPVPVTYDYASRSFVRVATPVNGRAQGGEPHEPVGAPIVVGRLDSHGDFTGVRNTGAPSAPGSYSARWAGSSSSAGAHGGGSFGGGHSSGGGVSMGSGGHAGGGGGASGGGGSARPRG